MGKNITNNIIEIDEKGAILSHYLQNKGSKFEYTYRNDAIEEHTCNKALGAFYR